VELVDTHCHLDFNKFDVDRDEVIHRARLMGLTHILIPGINIDSSRIAVKIAESDPTIYASIGFQPNDSLKWEVDSPHDLESIYLDHLINTRQGNRKIVAIGEIGLDYYWEVASHQHQKEVLNQQLVLAAELELPVILHMREKEDADFGECTEDLLEMIENWMDQLKRSNKQLSAHPGVFHSFSGNLDTAQKAISLGFYIGVTGPVTYLNARRRQDLIANIPVEHLLLETDSPFLTPHPYRGQRNEPAHVQLVARKVAEIHHTTLVEVATQTSINARQLFNW